MHKSVDVALLQHRIGGATGICCQKVSEAEAFARGGIRDILVSNEVRDPVKIDRLAQLPRLGARIGICVDDATSVAELSAAAQRHGTSLDVYVEIDCGGGRCGVSPGPEVAAIARAITTASGLRFSGLQAYQGRMQHILDFDARKAEFDAALAAVRTALGHLSAASIPCPAVTGGGTGSFELEGASGIWTELQCGSYAFMDAHYLQVVDGEGRAGGLFAPALFVLASIMSKTRPGRAVCDAGLKVLAVDSGLPAVHDASDVTYAGASDEHGLIADPGDRLAIRDRVKLVPGHCDPTVNLHDWYVGLRGGRVECVWPVSARGKVW